MNPYTKKSVLRAGVGGRWTVLLLAALLLGPSGARATDIYRGPMQTLATTKPNLIIGLDDSMYMDTEFMFNTWASQFWWNSTFMSSGTGWDSNGAPLFRPNRDYESQFNDATRYNAANAGAYAYLFPTTCTPAESRGLLCGWTNYMVLPPTIQFASLRSKDYNPLFYDPGVNYQPWPNATIGGVSKSFPPAVPTAARFNPLFSASADLTATLPYTGDGSQLDFRGWGGVSYIVLPGMTVPAGTRFFMGGPRSYDPDSYTVNAARTMAVGEFPPGGFHQAIIPYYPATYWMKQSCSVDDVSCTRAPDGATIQRYEIKAGNSFPGGRSYTAELQNFANWFTYHRNLRFMLASAMGQALGGVSGLRLGVLSMSFLSGPVTMADIDSDDPLANGQVVLGRFYQTIDRSGWWPVLHQTGKQYQTNTSIIQSACQRNAALVVTGGYPYSDGSPAPAYDTSTWGSWSPYARTWEKSLADYALSFYTINLRPDLPTGKVPTVVPTAANPSADNNPNLHMNTYGITLAVQGELWKGSGNAFPAYNPPPGWPTLYWPPPVKTGSPTNVDDLWHATVNGRGTMATTLTPAGTATALQDAMNHIRQLAGQRTGGTQSSTGGVVFSTVNLKAGNALAYVGTYRASGAGDVSAYAVDTTTGALASTATWSANAQLQARDYRTRAIASFDGSSGVAFTAAKVGGLVNPGGANGVSADLVAYLRGNRTLEGSSFRSRTGLMGAVVNAEPVSLPTEGVLFATDNNGMVHALDQSDGKELWAYVPGFALANAGATSQKSWNFQTLLDATPTLGKVNDRILLVGGRGSAGAGFYALDVTTPKGSATSATESPSDANVAARVLWEFPSASTPAAVVSSLGLSMGKPVIVNSHRYGQVVILSSGYNSRADGKGRVFVLKALTGELLNTFVTTAGRLGTGDAGLTQLAGFSEPDGTVNHLYGGDLLGHVWRFSLEDGSVLRLATLADSAGNAQPVTAIPELATVNRRRMVLVGTGRLLGQSDLDDTKVQSFYALRDNGVTIANPRASLAARSIAVNAGKRTVSGSAIDWGTQQGWVVDLPAGEKAHSDPSIAYGILSFTTNNPSPSTCSVGSALYLVDLQSGLQLADSVFPDRQPIYGLALGNTLTGRVSISRLPSGAIEVVTHQSDNSSSGRLLNPGVSTKLVKKAWKAVLR